MPQVTFPSPDRPSVPPTYHKNYDKWEESATEFVKEFECHNKYGNARLVKVSTKTAMGVQYWAFTVFRNRYGFVEENTWDVVAADNGLWYHSEQEALDHGIRAALGS